MKKNNSSLIKTFGAIIFVCFILPIISFFVVLDVFITPEIANVELDINSLLMRFVKIFVLVILCLFPIVIFFMIIFYKGVTKNIVKTDIALREITSGNYDYILPETYTFSEFAKIRQDFNIMSKELKQRFSIVYSEELALRDAKMKALQSQINPHFLNNTLEIIKWEILLKNSEGAINMMEALSTMMKASTDRHNATFITIFEELEYLNAYLFIVSERSKKLEIIREFPEETLNLKIPRLILQPIVENAVEHGEKTDGESMCSIIIRARIYEELVYGKLEGVLYLEVENDTPLSRKNQQRVSEILSGNIKHRTHIGISNVKERLKLSYGDNANFEIVPSDYGTVARIKIVLSK